MLEERSARKMLSIGMLRPRPDHVLVAQVVRVFKIHQPDRQTNVGGRPPFFVGKGRRQRLLELIPIHLARQEDQRVIQTNNFISHLSGKNFETKIMAIFHRGETPVG